MAFKREWTVADEKKLHATVRKATSVDDAIARAAAAFPKDNHSRETIDRRLVRAGYPTLTKILLDNGGPAGKTILASRRDKDTLAELKAAQEYLISELADREKQIEALKNLSNVRPIKPIVAGKRVGAKQRRGTPQLTLSDWHVEERVDPKTVNGLNKYDLDIADRCISEVAEAFAWMHRDPRFDVREAIVALLGDLFSGYIHEELAEGNFLSPVQAGAWLLPRLEKMLRTMAAKCESIERFVVVCNDGNHGRLTRKMRVATRTANSLEWFLYFNLAQRMSDDPRFVFQIADGAWNYVEVYDRVLGFTHGDNYRYLGGVGGLLIPVRRGLNEDRKYRRLDHVSMGHFHTRHDFEDISVNGSMIGITPYSMSIHCPPEKRQQSWFMLDQEYGKCLSAPIVLPQTATGFANARIERTASRPK